MIFRRGKQTLFARNYSPARRPKHAVRVQSLSGKYVFHFVFIRAQKCAFNPVWLNRAEGEVNQMFANFEAGFLKFLTLSYARLATIRVRADVCSNEAIEGL